MDEADGDHFDVIVIGGGPGGYAAALYGASAGLRIALVERDKVGGTCLHRGCIPAKELLESASVYRTVRHAAEFGVHVGEPSIDWSATIDRKQRVVDQMFTGLGSLLKGRKVEVVPGSGVLEADGRVTVETDAGSRTLLDLRELPGSAAVIGGGAIGCEFASTLADMGASVTILEGLPKILPGCDEEIAKVVTTSFKKRGLTIRTGVRVTGHQPQDGGGTAVQIEGSDPLFVDMVVVSVGRRPVTDGVLGDGCKVAVSPRGFFEVDAHGRTGVPGVWAVGDCIDTPQLAHVAFMEGMNAIRDILGEDPPPIDAGRVPWAIYCQPEVAFAGYTEAAAKEAGFDVVTAKHRFIGNGRAVIIQGYLAVNWEATVDEIAALIQPHPTMSELFGETVLSLTGRSLH